MKKILVFQHVAHEVLGTFDPLLRNNGFRIKYVNFARNPDAVPEPKNYDGLIVLGGPMNVDQESSFPHLKTEMRGIETALKHNIPILGICLGAQLIAKTLGAAVKRNPEKEIGWYDLSLTSEGFQDPHFQHFEHTEKIFQWHGDTFGIPQTAVHLATSPTCHHQGFRYKDKTYGLQFHLEVDDDMIRHWLTVPGNKKEIEELGGRINPDKICEETATNINRLKELSQKTFTQFLSLFGPMKKIHRLPSK